jgi:hypothetical protein
VPAICACNLCLGAIEKGSIVGSCKTIINMPCYDAYYPHPLAVDVIKNENGVVSFTAQESEASQNFS